MRLSRMASFLAGALLTGSIGAFAADSASTGTQTQSGTTGPAATTTASVTTAGATRVEDRIASEFAIFSGSQDNARSLVTGLRHGSEVTLAAPTGDGQAGTSNTFSPPTRPMGYGNVRISLALAQEQLIRLGVTQPTADQLKAALVGGTVTSGSGSTATTTELQGVLQMRAQGMGWGQIANAMGTKLGHVMSGLKQTNQQLATGQPVPGAGAATESGSTTANAAQPRAQGQGSARAGAGIVTAGGAASNAGAGVRANADVRGAGIVTGAGVAAGGHGALSGKGLAKGHIKN